MRKIGIPEIEDIATGAALLGAGGGGDPYVGKLVAIGAVQECGPVTLLEPEEVPDDALVVPIAMMGAYIGAAGACSRAASHAARAGRACLQSGGALGLPERNTGAAAQRQGRRASWLWLSRDENARGAGG